MSEKTIQWGKNNVVHKCYWNNWIFTRKEVGLLAYSTYKNELKIDPTAKYETKLYNSYKKTHGNCLDMSTAMFGRSIDL